MSKIKVVLELDTECTTNGGTYVIYKNDIIASKDYNLSKEEFIALEALVYYFHSITYKCAKASNVTIIGEQTP